MHQVKVRNNWNYEYVASCNDCGWSKRAGTEEVAVDHADRHQLNSIPMTPLEHCSRVIVEIPTDNPREIAQALKVHPRTARFFTDVAVPSLALYIMGHYTSPSTTVFDMAERASEMMDHNVDPRGERSVFLPA